jgi:hypothetical protein
VVFAQARAPIGEGFAQPLQHRPPAIELDAMALAVVEADRFDMLVALQRPGQTGGRVLAAGEQHQRALVHEFSAWRRARLRAWR